MAKVPNGVDRNIFAENFKPLSRAHECYRQQTDRQMTDRRQPDDRRTDDNTVNVKVIHVHVR